MNHPYKVKVVRADLSPAVRASVCQTPDPGRAESPAPCPRGLGSTETQLVSKPREQHTVFEGPVLSMGHSTNVFCTSRGLHRDPHVPGAGMLRALPPITRWVRG